MKTIKTVKVQNLTARVPKETLNASDSSNLVQVHPMISLNTDMVNELSKFGVLFMNKQEADNQTDYWTGGNLSRVVFKNSSSDWTRQICLLIG